MSDNVMQIRPYLTTDEEVVLEIWQKCGLLNYRNNPRDDIGRKLKVNPELFLVGLLDDKVVATVMGGYEGHRGWINYLAVDPSYQRRGLGRRIMGEIESRIRMTGCPKINLQVRSDNGDIVKFYENIGYNTEERISMGKRLVNDEER